MSFRSVVVLNRCQNPQSLSGVCTSGETSQDLGAKLGALADAIAGADAELAQLLSAWAGLPKAMRAAIMAIVQAATPANRDKR